MMIFLLVCLWVSALSRKPFFNYARTPSIETFDLSDNALSSGFDYSSLSSLKVRPSFAKLQFIIQ